MSIKRRVKIRKKVKVKRRPKLTEWKRLYNRLEAEDSDFDVYQIVAQKSKHGGDIDGELFDALTSIISRFDTEIKTLQINHKTPTYRVFMIWTNRAAKPKWGYLYPRLYSVKSSTDLWRAVILAYLEICHHARTWL